MNAAFVLAQKLNVSCVIFHDVDMFPQVDYIPYDCSKSPSHLGAIVNTLGYQYVFFLNLTKKVLKKAKNFFSYKNCINFFHFI